MNRLRLEGKTAVISGVGSGMGRAIAKMFAEEGAAVCATDYNAETGQKTVDEICAAGGKAVFVRCDLTKKEDIAHLHDEALKALGSVTTLVNAAGVLVHGAFMDQTDENMQFIHDTNFRGTVWMMKAFLPDLVKTGNASITNIASISVFKPESYAYYYGAYKAAIAILSRNLAREYTPQGVRINVICPGPVDTNMTPPQFRSGTGDPEAIKGLIETTMLVQRLGVPDDIAYCATYLASDEASWVSAAQFVIDGGATFGGANHFKIKGKA